MTISLDASKHPVKSVTIFQSSTAELKRVFTVYLKAGTNVITISNISSYVDKESTRIHGLGNDARVVDISCKHAPDNGQSYMNSRNAADIKDLTTKLKLLEGERNVCIKESDLLDEAARSLVGDKGSGLGAFMEEYASRKRSAMSKVLNLEEQIEELDQELWKLANTHQGKTSASVTANVLAKHDCKIDLQLTYLVTGVTWQPYYDLHATTSDGKPSSMVCLNYCANITQTTGEDWNNVTLTLSTANSHALRSLSVPRVDPLQFVTPVSAGFGAFGTTNAAASAFNNNTVGSFSQSTAGSIFGQPAATGGVFGQTTSQPGGVFGQTAPPPATGGVFGQTSAQPVFGGSLFGQAATQPATGGSFAQFATTQPATGSLFGQPAATQPITGSLFSAKPATGGGVFGQGAAQPATGSLFGKVTTGGSLFGQSSGTGGLFSQSFFAKQLQQPQQAAPAASTFSQPTPPVQQQRVNLFGQTNAAAPQAPAGVFNTLTPNASSLPSMNASAAPSSNSRYSSDPDDEEFEDVLPEEGEGGQGAVLDRSPLSLAYRVEGKVSLVSDGIAHKVSITVLDFGAAIKYVCVPKKTNAAFIEADIKNTSEFELLAGPVSVFMDDSFVTKTFFSPIGVNESFVCILGIDTSLKVEYESKARTVCEPQRSFSEPFKLMTRTASTVITNNHPFDITDLVVRAAVPLGNAQARISVMLRKPEGLAQTKDGESVPVKLAGETKGATVRWMRVENGAGGEKDGLYEWLCTVKAGKKIRLEALWDVKAPRSTRLEEQTSIKFGGAK